MYKGPGVGGYLVHSSNWKKVYLSMDTTEKRGKKY